MITKSKMWRHTYKTHRTTNACGLSLNIPFQRWVQAVKEFGIKRKHMNDFKSMVVTIQASRLHWRLPYYTYEYDEYFYPLDGLDILVSSVGIQRESWNPLDEDQMYTYSALSSIMCSKLVCSSQHQQSMHKTIHNYTLLHIDARRHQASVGRLVLYNFKLHCGLTNYYVCSLIVSTMHYVSHMFSGIQTFAFMRISTTTTDMMDCD